MGRTSIRGEASDAQGAFRGFPSMPPGLACPQVPGEPRRSAGRRSRGESRLPPAAAAAAARDCRERGRAPRSHPKSSLRARRWSLSGFRRVLPMTTPALRARRNGDRLATSAYCWPTPPPERSARGTPRVVRRTVRSFRRLLPRPRKESQSPEACLDDPAYGRGRVCAVLIRLLLLCLAKIARRKAPRAEQMRVVRRTVRSFRRLLLRQR